MKYPNFRSIVIIFISIVIIFSCAYYNTLKEGLTNNIILNNSNYIPEKKNVLDKVVI
jgi:hypothetical protein